MRQRCPGRMPVVVQRLTSCHHLLDPFAVCTKSGQVVSSQCVAEVSICPDRLLWSRRDLGCTACSQAFAPPSTLLIQMPLPSCPPRSSCTAAWDNKRPEACPPPRSTPPHTHLTPAAVQQAGRALALRQPPRLREDLQSSGRSGHLRLHQGVSAGVRPVSGAASLSACRWDLKRQLRRCWHMHACARG